MKLKIVAKKLAHGRTYESPKSAKSVWKFVHAERDYSVEWGEIGVCVFLDAELEDVEASVLDHGTPVEIHGVLLPVEQAIRLVGEARALEWEGRSTRWFGDKSQGALLRVVRRTLRSGAVQVQNNAWGKHEVELAWSDIVALMDDVDKLVAWKPKGA